MSDDPVADCAECGSEAQRLISGGAGLLFKGEGFYITDYRSEGYKKAAREGAGDGSSSREGEGGRAAKDKGGSEGGRGEADKGGREGGDKAKPAPAKASEAAPGRAGPSAGSAPASSGRDRRRRGKDFGGRARRPPSSKGGGADR